MKDEQSDEYDEEADMVVPLGNVAKQEEAVTHQMQNLEVQQQK